MAWTTPRTWVTGETVTAAQLNTHVRDNLNYLKTTTDAGFADSGWTTPTLGNSWVAFGAGYDAPQYRLYYGVVYLKGVMKSGTVATTVFTLPAGYRPLNIRGYACASGTGTCRIGVSSVGAVTVDVYQTGGSNASVFLDGVTFPAEQ